MKLWFVIAISLVVIGLIVFVVVMTACNWDFTKLSTAKFETNTYEVREEFSNIWIKTDTADILFAPSDDGICRVVCYEQENEKHSVAVQNDTLTVNVVNRRKWYEYMGITIGTPKIRIYLPNAEYASLYIKESTGDIEIPKDFMLESIHISNSTGDIKNEASASGVVKIDTNTGNIHVENVSAGSLDLSVSTGKITVSGVSCEGDVTVSVSTGKTELTDVACKSIVSRGSTGDASLKNVIATEKISVERSTGDVKLESCDAGELFLKTDTGDVAGTLLSEKVFIIEADTGSVNVPQTLSGGKCEIITNTGDIKIEIP